MAQVISQWTLNDPTTLHRVWDNSGNKHHGDFGAKKPEVVLDSPNGTRAMYWTGSNVLLPEVSGVQAISYWMKASASSFNSMIPADGQWHLFVVSEGKAYLDGELQSTSVQVSDAVSALRNALDGGSGFYLSDIIYYGSGLSASEVTSILEVKTRLTNQYELHCKEVFESDERSSISVNRAGIVSAKEIEATGEAKILFGREGNIYIGKVVEQ